MAVDGSGEEKEEGQMKGERKSLYINLFFLYNFLPFIIIFDDGNFLLELEGDQILDLIVLGGVAVEKLVEVLEYALGLRVLDSVDEDEDVL